MAEMLSSWRRGARGDGRPVEKVRRQGRAFERPRVLARKKPHGVRVEEIGVTQTWLAVTNRLKLLLGASG